MQILTCNASLIASTGLVSFGVTVLIRAVYNML